MSAWKFCLLLAAAFAAGCASAPEEIIARTDVQPSASVAGDVEPVIVQLEDINVDPASVVTCREMLKQGSNVIVATCMSASDWKRFERQQAQEAAAIVRTLQGGAFR